MAGIKLRPAGTVGHGLNRPECVVAAPDGTIYASDARGGILAIAPDGRQAFVGGVSPGLVPNGFALTEGGRFLIANMGEAGGIWCADAAAPPRPLIDRADGRNLDSVNFVLPDAAGLWITVSTATLPRAKAFRSDLADGYVVRIDGRGARIAADGLGFANECRIAPDGRHLYVSETMARRISRFAIAPDGALGSRETFAAFGEGDYPDGIAFDAQGHLWAVSIVSNRIYRVAPDGRPVLVLADARPDHVARVERARAANALEPAHFHASAGRRLHNISSLAFHGPDLRTIVCGSLAGKSLPLFESPVAGLPAPLRPLDGLLSRT